MISKNSATTSSNEKKASQESSKRNIDTKSSGNETSSNTVGGKPERRRRKFSPLEKDISSRLFPGSGINQKAKTGLEADKSAKKSEIETPLTKNSRQNEDMNKPKSKSDAASSSSSSSGTFRKTLPQQDMQTDQPVSTSSFTDVIISKEETKRKIDSKKDNNDYSRETKKSRKNEVDNKNLASSSPTLLPGSNSTDIIKQKSESSMKNKIPNSNALINKHRRKSFEDNKNGQLSGQEPPNSQETRKTQNDSISSTSEEYTLNQSVRGKEILTLTTNMDTNNESPRKQHILALLRHRQMLIERVRMCKDSARNTLETSKRKEIRDNDKIEIKSWDVSKEDAPSKKENIKKGQTKREKLKKEFFFEFREHEKMSENVSQTVKRQRSVQSSMELEKNRAPPIRRASSKKHLQTNVQNDQRSFESTSKSLQYNITASKSTTSANQTPINVPAAKSTQSITSLANTSFPQPSSALQIKSSSNPFSNNINGNATQIRNVATGSVLSGKNPSYNKQSHITASQFSNNPKSMPIPSNSNKSFNTNSTIKQIHEIHDKNQNVKLKNNGSAIQKNLSSKNVNGFQNGQFASTSALTTMSKSNESNGEISFAVNNITPPANSEVAALRQKRKKILDQLMTLQKERKRKYSLLEMGNIIAGTHHVQNISKAQNVKKILPQKKLQSSQELSLQSLRLPPHRKTHWTYLLEEMRWLATDFMEERKWKVSSASTLSNIVVSNRSTIMQKFFPSKEIRQGKGVIIKQAIESTFIRPTPSDIDQAKKKASLISRAVSEYWDAIVDGGVCVDEGYNISETLKTYNADDASTNVTSKTHADINIDGKTSEMNINPLSVYSSNVSKCEVESDSTSTTLRFIENDDGFNKMTSRIDEVSKKACEIKVQAEQLSQLDIEESLNHFLPCGLRLTNTQIKAMQFVENLWNMPVSGVTGKHIDGDVWKPSHFGCGAILHGYPNSGKTISVCSLLWKYRGSGPQLLLCPPSSLIKWRHEIRRFKGLQVFTLGPHGGSYGKSLIESDMRTKFLPGDVIVCDFTCLTDIDYEAFSLDKFCLDHEHQSTYPTLLKVRWASVAVDLRFSSQQYKYPSIDPSSLSQASNVNLWQFLLENLQFTNNERKRKIIVRGLHDEERSVLMEKKVSALQNNHTLSKIFAFIFPASIISYYNPRRIISWAKKTYQMKKKDDKRRKVDFGISKELHRAMENFELLVEEFSPRSISPPGCLDHMIKVPVSYNLNFERNVRKCEMGNKQRTSYRQCCSYVRGALSANNLTRSNHIPIAADALLRLRQVCLHADVWKILDLQSDFPLQKRSLSRLSGGFKKETYQPNKMQRMRSECRRSSAQPDVSFAQNVLEGSAKISELLKILILEAGVRSALKMQSNESGIFLKSIGQTIAKNHRVDYVSSEKKAIKKVLIIATLPEAQLLIHRFLDACGISHEILISSNQQENSHVRTTHEAGAYAHNFECSDTVSYNEISSVFEWACGQRSLSRFDQSTNSFNESEQKAMNHKTDIIIASPVAIGASSGGLSAGAADIIICFDEDWSGRGLKLIESFLQKSHTRRHNEETKTKVIKLLCKNSCEDCFFSEYFGSVTSSMVQNSHNDIDEDLTQEIKEKVTSESITNKIEFQTDENGYILGSIYRDTQQPELVLGRQILAFRNNKLSQILRAPLTRGFATGKEQLFLPLHKVRAPFSHEKVEEENHISVEMRNTSWLKEDYELGQELARIEAKVCPLTNNIGSDLNSTISTKSFNFKKFILFTMASPPITSFSCSIVSRMDLKSMSVRMYCERFGREFILDDKFTKAAIDDTVGREFGTNLADSWSKSGVGSTPGNQAMPLIYYNAYEEKLGPTKALHEDCKKNAREMDCSENANLFKDSHNTESSLNKPSKMHEAISTPFSTLEDLQSLRIRDGNNGLEPLLYAPPLFPGLLAGLNSQGKNESNEIVTPTPIPDLSSPSVSANFGDNFEIDKAIMDSSNDLLDLSADLLSPSGSNILAGVDDTLDIYSLTPSAQIDTNEKIDTPSNSDPFSLKPDFSLNNFSSDLNMELDGGAIRSNQNSSSPKFSNGESFPEEKNNLYMEREEGKKTEYDKFNFDFLGKCGLKLQIDSFSAAAKTPAETASYKFWRDPFDSYLPMHASDNEESCLTVASNALDDTFLNLDCVLLYVKKKPKTNQFSSTSNHLSTQSITQISSSHNSETSAMRVNKQDRARHRLDALTLRKNIITRVEIALLPSSTPVSNKKELNDSADVNFELNSGPSPLIVSLPESTEVGHSAKALAKKQIESLKKGMRKPTMVDFGPFQNGYLSSKNGMDVVSHPSTLAGTSLPMGVKQIDRENGFDMQPWTNLEDAKLKEVAQKFYQNWTIISQAVSRANISCESNQCSVERFQQRISRSPRQCRERFQTYSIKEVQNIQHLHKKTSAKKTVQAMSNLKVLSNSLLNASGSASSGTKEDLVVNKMAVKKYNVLFFPPKRYKARELNPRNQSKQILQENLGTNSNGMRKKYFSKLTSASNKRDRISIPIPGYTGDNNISMVQPHPSHIQAVKDVVTKSNGGTAEMWPLPLLDLADKQRSSRLHLNHHKPPSYQHQVSQQPNSVSGTTQHRPTNTPGNAVAPSHQHNKKHQTRPQHNHSYQQMQKIQVNQQQPIMQHPRTHASVNYNKQQTQVKNPSMSNQHELVKQAARAIALAPTTNIRNSHTKPNMHGKATSIPTLQRPMQLNAARDFAATNDPLSIHASMSTNNCPPQISPVNTHANPSIGMSPLRGNTPNTSSN